MISDTAHADDKPKMTERSVPKSPGAFDVPILTVVMAAVLFYAWTQSGEGHLTAESGPGYYLGISGSVMMLLLLIYPLRKRIRGLRKLGTIPAWFRLHMMFGVVGPALVVLHSNFTLGSLNSRVALFSMLIVAGSGYIGRFLYRRIHRGLTGRWRSAGELRDQAGELWRPMTSLSEDDHVATRLAAFERRFLSKQRSLVAALCHLPLAKHARKELRRDILRIVGSDRPSSHDVDAYLEATRRAQAFVVYERLFSLWHLLHLPLFIVLVAAALLHIFAVHLY